MRPDERDRTRIDQPSIDRPRIDLDAIDGVVSDMDGVLWRGSETLPGVREFFVMLRARGVPFVLATNNSGTDTAAYVERLRQIGVPDVTEREVITSGSVTVDHLRAHHAPGTRVHLIGSPALGDALEGAGFVLAEEAEVVVVGIDLALTYAKLERAATLILDGAEFIGTNGDAALPTPHGLAPGTGSILAALSAATGRRPRLMGKPEAPMYRSAVRRLGTEPRRTLMIGDRLETDILGARRLGMPTALVLTGVTTLEAAEAGGLEPGPVVRDLPELMDAWNAVERPFR